MNLRPGRLIIRYMARNAADKFAKSPAVRPPRVHGPKALTISAEAVIERAVEIIGDRPKAMRWLGAPVRALDYATPISRLHDKAGQAAVLQVLTKLEHGVL